MSLPFDSEVRTGSSESVLASLYRKILSDLNITGARFDMLLVKFVRKTYKDKNSNKDQTSIKSNTYKELLKDRITFKVFLKGLQVLNFTKFDIMVRLHHQDGTTTVHERTVLIHEEVDDEQ